MKTVVVVKLFCFVLFSFATLATPLPRPHHRRNNLLKSIFNIINTTKCGRHLVQDNEYHNSKDRVFDYLWLSNAEKGCMQTSFDPSSIAMIELKRLYEWLIFMKNTTKKFGSPSCFQNISRSSSNLEVCLSHLDDHSLLNIENSIYQTILSTFADFRKKSFCRGSRYKTEHKLLSCYVGHFKSSCSIPNQTRYTTIHSNPAMEVCTLFSSEMTRHILRFWKH